MLKKELITVLERLEEYYRNFYYGSDKERVLNAWYPMFRDDEAGEVNRAAITYICTEKYAPSVAGIKTIMAENRMAGQMTEMEAWNQIRKAIDAANGRTQAAEAYAKLPPILRKLVCEPNRLRVWFRCDDNTLEGVIASNIQRSYRELAKREAVYYAIPGQLQSEQEWRVKGPKEVTALPEPEITKTISQVVEEANTKAAEHRTLTDELRKKHASGLDAFLAPMSKDEKRIVERREDKKAERFLK